MNLVLTLRPKNFLTNLLDRCKKMATHETHDKIINYIDFILKHPRELKYFSFDEGRTFIVDGNRIKMLPTEYAKFYQRDEFYISVDPDAKKVIYYAFDVENYTSDEHVNDSLGFFEWDKVSEQILTFLSLHLKELTTSTTPYTDIAEKKTSTSSSSSSHSRGTEAMARCHNSDYPYSGSTGTYSGVGSSSTTRYNYSNSYKEREVFNSKLTDLMKECKTAAAIDHIKENISKMCEEKKFENVDDILRWITFDKLNIPIMLTFLDLTRGADHILKQRKEFYDKVKNHLMKIKPARAGHILRNMEPGKEYKNVVKYEAK